MMSSQSGRRRSDEELQAIYDDRYAAEYDPYAVPRIERMRPFFDLSGQDVVADFGCGNGVLLEVIGPLVREYLGVDFSDAFAPRPRAGAMRWGCRTVPSTAQTSSTSAAHDRTSSMPASPWIFPSTSTTINSCASSAPSTGR